MQNELDSWSYSSVTHCGLKQMPVTLHGTKKIHVARPLDMVEVLGSNFSQCACVPHIPFDSEATAI